jgi:hypothetical protein
MILYFYAIGCFIAMLLGCRLFYKERDKDNVQIGMIIPLILLARISVILIIWKLSNKL